MADRITHSAESRFTASDRLFVVVFLILTTLDLLTIRYSPLDLSPDEAHYAMWARDIDWSYYSKGPAVAILIRAGTMLFGASAFAVRLPAICCFAFFSILFYIFLRQLAGPRAAFAGWLASRAMLIFAQMGILMTTDAPAALLWLVALICAHRAVCEEELPYWIGFGAAVGLGVLAKYTVAILYPSVFLLLFFTRHLRRHLVHPAFIAGFIVFLFACFPILKWNADHGWVNIVHNARHIAHSNGVGLSPLFFFELVLGQLGLVGPIIFCGMMYAFLVGIHEWKEDDRVSGLLVFSSLPLAILLVAISFTKRVYANWPLPVYIGGLLLLTHLIANYRIVSQQTTRLIKPGILLSALVTAGGYAIFFGVTAGVRTEMLPTRKLVGWSELGRKVDELLAVKHLAGMPVVIATDYQIASEIGFYSTAGAEILCANVGDRRMNQFDIWDGWGKVKGRDALIVLKDPAGRAQLEKHFSGLEELPERLPVQFGGETIRTFHFFVGRNYDGTTPPEPWVG